MSAADTIVFRESIAGDDFILVDQFTSDGVRRSMIQPAKLPKFRKKSLTRAYRMSGPFTVDTSEGRLTCQDGYVCIDARGYPYPVAKEEFDLIYEPAQEGEQ